MKELDVFTHSKFMKLFGSIAKGVSLSMPMSRPMPTVAHGVHELRVKNTAGEYRVFYFTKHCDEILVFHFFQKKKQKTPKIEIETGRRRLGEML